MADTPSDQPADPVLTVDREAADQARNERYLRRCRGRVKPEEANPGHPPQRLRCTLRGHHNGAHSTELRLRSRTPVLVQPKARRRSPATFPWCLLNVDLQASVLVQLECEATELMRHLARLACHLRPLRPAILRATRLDARLTALLDAGWTASRRKLAPTKCELRCSWRGAQSTGTTSVVLNERVTLKLNLQRDADAPRRWRWKLQLMWDVNSPSGRWLCAVSYEAFLSTAGRGGVPPLKGRFRRHKVQCSTNGVCIASLRQMNRLGVCWRRQVFGRLDHTQLCIANGALRLVCDHELLVEWTLSSEALCAMHLVCALV